MPWQPSTPRRAGQRAEAALKANPYRSDELIGARARTSKTPVARARRELEQAKQIPAVPVARRARQPYPRQASRTHDAILALGGRATPRQVADLAGISRQAAWKALRAHREREPIPAPPAEPLDCDRCGRPFVPAARPGGRPPRFCSDACADRAWEAGRRARRAGTRAWPVIRELPPVPEAVWLSGACTRPGTEPVWTSDDEQDRAKAIAICRACPVRAHVCLPWIMQAPDLGGDTIYAGMDLAGRRELRRRGLRRSAV